MSVLNVRLLGRLDVRRDEQTVVDLQPRKAQELFAYLLLQRRRSHTREALANLMWPGNNSGQTRKYLRHTLWQLQKALSPVDPAPGGNSGPSGVLLADPDAIQLNPRTEIWLDVAEFEDACALARETPSRELDRSQIEAVQTALDLYRGDLLEGWYQDWCLFERERLQHLYLALLEKRMIYCEAHGEYEIGLVCGTRALRCDVAHERIHRRMMRLHHLSGDRTGALRQYERCVAFLREELDTEPSARTVTLYEQIRSDDAITEAAPDRDSETPSKRLLSPPETLKQLEQLQTALRNVQHQLEETIETFEVALAEQDRARHRQQLPPKKTRHKSP